MIHLEGIDRLGELLFAALEGDRIAHLERAIELDHADANVIVVVCDSADGFLGFWHSGRGEEATP